MKKFVTDNPWGAIKEDLKGKRPPVTAIVSFIGANGDTLLPLKSGDSLVCKADESTIKLGLTNPETLTRFLKKGVRIYSIQGLHAKVIVGEDFAWVGSANASDSSLLEATVRVGKNDSRAVREWAKSLCMEAWELSPKALSELLAIKAQSSPRLRRPLESTIEWPKIKTLQLWWFGADDFITQKADAKARAEIRKNSVSPREAAYMRSLGYTEGASDDESVKEGQWFIAFNYWGRPRPCRVVRITPHETLKIVWFKAAKTVRTPRLSEIEAIVPGWRYDYEDWGMTVTNRRDIERIGELFS